MKFDKGIGKLGVDTTSPEYELARELITGEFNNAFPENGQLATPEEISALTKVIMEQQKKTPTLDGVVNSAAVNDYLSGLSGKHGKKFGNGGQILANYEKELDAMTDEQLAKEYARETGIDENDLIGKDGIEDEREDMTGELLRLYRQTLKSRGEMADGGQIKFQSLSNKQLISAANAAIKRGNWDDESSELRRRHDASNGSFDYELKGNTVVLIKDAKPEPISFEIKENADSPNYKKAIEFAKKNGYSIKSDISYNGYVYFEKTVNNGDFKIEFKVYDGKIKDKQPDIDIYEKTADFGSIMSETQYRFTPVHYDGFTPRDLEVTDLDSLFAMLTKKEKELNQMKAKGGNVSNYEIELEALPNHDFDRNSHEANVHIKKHKVAISSIAEARTKALNFIAENDLGGGNYSSGMLYKNGKKIGRIAYNGRVWGGDGKEMKYANGGELTREDEYSAAITRARQTQDFEKDAIEYAGKENWAQLSPEEKRQILVELEKDYERRQHFAKGGEVDVPEMNFKKGDVWVNKFYATYPKAAFGSTAKVGSEELNLAVLSEQELAQMDGCKVEVNYISEGAFGGYSKHTDTGTIRVEYLQTDFPNFNRSKAVMFFVGKKTAKYRPLSVWHGNVVTEIKILDTGKIDRSYSPDVFEWAVKGIEETLDKAAKFEFDGQYQMYQDLEGSQSRIMRVMNGTNKAEQAAINLLIDKFNKVRDAYTIAQAAHSGRYFEKIKDGRMTAEEVIKILDARKIPVPENILALYNEPHFSAGGSIDFEQYAKDNYGAHRWEKLSATEKQQAIAEAKLGYKNLRDSYAKGGKLETANIGKIKVADRGVVSKIWDWQGKLLKEVFVNGKKYTRNTFYSTYNSPINELLFVQDKDNIRAYEDAKFAQGGSLRQANLAYKAAIKLSAEKIQEAEAKGIVPNQYEPYVLAQKMAHDAFLILYPETEKTFKKPSHYSRYGEGGTVSVAELMQTDFLLGDAKGIGEFEFVTEVYDQHQLSRMLSELNKKKIPYVAEKESGYWALLVLQNDKPTVNNLINKFMRNDENDFEQGQEVAGQYAKGGSISTYIKHNGLQYVSAETLQKIKDTEQLLSKNIPQGIREQYESRLRRLIETAVDEVENRVQGFDGNPNDYVVKFKQGGNIARDRMFVSEQAWEQAYKPNRVTRGKHYHHHFAKGGKVGGALVYFQSLDLTKLPTPVAEHIKAMLEHPEINLLDENDVDFVELKGYIEQKFADAIKKPEPKKLAPTKKEKLPVKEVVVTEPETTVTPTTVLRTRIKVIRGMIADGDKTPTLKTRIKIIEGMIAEQEKSGDGVIAQKKEITDADVAATQTAIKEWVEKLKEKPDADEMRNILHFEWIKKLLKVGYTQKEVLYIMIGYGVVEHEKIKADTEFGGIHRAEGITTLRPEYVQKEIDKYLKVAEENIFELGLKYPTFNWKEVIKKYNISLSPKIEVIERGGSKQKYAFFVGDKVVIGQRLENGKDVAQDGKFNDSYWGVVSRDKTILEDIAAMLLSQKSGYLKDLDIFANGLGGIDATDLKQTAIKYCTGGAVEFARGGKTGLPAIDFNLPEDYEYVGKIANALRAKGIDAHASYFDQYQGAYIRANGKKFWGEDLYYTGTRKYDSGKTPKYKKAVLIDADGVWSANKGDYFNRPADFVFKKTLLRLTDMNGNDNTISNPKVSDLPDLNDVVTHFSYEAGTETAHIVLIDENDPENKIEVTEHNGKYDVSEFAAALGAKFSKGGTVPKWKEIKTFHNEEDGTVSIDAYLTDNQEEEGKVIATIDKEGKVTYHDSWAREDRAAQKVINGALAKMGKFARGGEVNSWHSSWGDKVGVRQISFSKNDYNVNVKIADLEVDVNIKDNDSVDGHALSDTGAEWNQHHWGYMIYPKTKEELFAVLRALKVQFSEKKIDKLLDENGYEQKPEPVEPQKDDNFISDARGGGYNVSWEGKFRGHYKEFDDAVAAIAEEQDRSKVWNNIWVVDERGSHNLIDREGNHIKMAKGGGVQAENDRMYNFLKDDLEKLEKAVSENDKEETDKFFSYWIGSNGNGHLKSLKTKANDRMYNFLKDDLGKLEKAVKENDKEEVDKFFSYWGHHLKSLKMAAGGTVGKTVVYNANKIPENVWENIYKLNSRFDDGELYVRKESDGAFYASSPDNTASFTFEKGNGLETDVWEYFNSTYAKQEPLHKIRNQYEGKTVEQVWDIWTPEQRLHFIQDHFDGSQTEHLREYLNSSFNEIPESAGWRFFEYLDGHITKGEYAQGGAIKVGDKVVNPDASKISPNHVGEVKKIDGDFANVQFRDYDANFSVNYLKQHLATGGSIWNKIKSGAHEAANKSKELYHKGKTAAEQKIHDKKKEIAWNVLQETRGIVNTKSDSILLNEASNLVEEHYAEGGKAKGKMTVRSREDFKKLVKIKQDFVKNLTPQEVADTWNKNSYGVIEGISKPMTLEYASLPIAKMYLSGLLVENELNEAEYMAYYAEGGAVEGEQSFTNGKPVKEGARWEQKMITFFDHEVAKGKTSEEWSFYAYSKGDLSREVKKQGYKDVSTRKLAQGGQLSDYDQWLGEIYDEIENLLEVTRSDAQGIVDAQDFYLAQSWGKGLTAKQTAKVIDEKSKVLEHGGKVDASQLEEVLTHYIAAALWSSYDGDDALDSNYSRSDLAPETLAKMKKNVSKFLSENAEAIKESGIENTQLGHSLWLTQNRHGAGFMDLNLDDAIEKKLVTAAQALGEHDLYAGDDGKIYKQGGKIGNVKKSISDIQKIDCFYNFSVKGNATQIPSDKVSSQMIDDYRTYLSDKEFLEKYSDLIPSSFDDDDFEENGSVDEFRVTMEYYITFKDGSEIYVDFSLPDYNFIDADDRDSDKKGTMAEKWLPEFNKSAGWDMDIDSLVDAVGGGTAKHFAQGGGVKYNSTRRANNSPLVEYANFEDGSHINLLRLIKPYASGHAYSISVSSIGNGQKVTLFKTLPEAEKSFNELVNKKAAESKLIKRGNVSANYGEGGEVSGKTMQIADAIFSSNAKKGKIETGFGAKTPQGLIGMLTNDSYTPTEIAEAIFNSNKQGDKIKTGWGDKRLLGLIEMVEQCRPTVASSEDMELASQLIDGELSNFDNNPLGYVESMGWDTDKYKWLKTESWAIGKSAADVQQLAAVIAGEREKGNEGLDLVESNKVQDWLSNFIAGKVNKIHSKKQKSTGGHATDKKWIDEAIKHKGALRKKALSLGLIKGDEKLSEKDFLELENLGKSWKKKVDLARTLAKFKAEGGAVDEEKKPSASPKKKTIEGVKHTKANGFDYHSAKRSDVVHPLGDVYVKLKSGYVASGYDWYKFNLERWNNHKK